MLLRRWFLIILTFVTPLTGVRPCSAQGTQADYARAANLHKLTEGKVFKTRVVPHWCVGNTRFWYRNDLPDQAREFVLVDALAGTRRAAFDHARLAEALGRALGRPIDKSRLPIDSLTFAADGTTVVVRCGQRRWRCDSAANRWEALPDEKPASLPARADIRPSRASDESTWITFSNRGAQEVELLWIDMAGKRSSYGLLKPGAERHQHSYAGHVWAVADRSGRVLAVFEATADVALAIVDRELFASPAGQPAPGNAPAGVLSPNGVWRAELRDHNLVVRDVSTGRETRLSVNGKAGDAYGGPLCWSPDSRWLVALQTQSGADRRVYYVESSPRDQTQPRLHSHAYLKPGDRIAHRRPRLFEVATGRGVPIDEALFPNPWDITQLRWEPDSRRFTFVYNQRGHQVLRVLAVEAASGLVRTIVDEQSRTFIDYAHKQFLHPLDGAHELIWMSERDGWNHLYLYDAQTGQVKNPITSGLWVVRGVERVDAQQRQVWFRAGGIRPEQDPYYEHYCRVNFDGSGLVVLTAGDGSHKVEFSPDGRFFVDTYSRVDRPPVVELRSAADGRLVCLLEEADWSALVRCGWQAPERFAAKGRDGQTDIFGVLFRPTNFDPRKKYPVIENIYAGPHGAFVPKTFHSYYAEQGLAELGFVVVKIDGQGTSQRSKAFHDVCWKNLGDAGFPDRIAWLRAAAAKDPSLDLTRVGIYGGSAGGQNAARALIAHHDFYQVAVADCGCHDNRMDKIWWNELWMGWPVGPHYAEHSNVTQARRLQGKLLLIVGEMDQNVDPASTMQVAAALIKADKDFELLVVPGAGHGAAETPYGSRRRQDFFVRHLLKVEPRAHP